jgi:hypothetical protein
VRNLLTNTFETLENIMMSWIRKSSSFLFLIPGIVVFEVLKCVCFREEGRQERRQEGRQEGRPPPR